MLPQENYEIKDALWCILGHSGSNFVGSTTARYTAGHTQNYALHVHIYAAFYGSAQMSSVWRGSRHFHVSY